jgi:hypothetical protein
VLYGAGTHSSTSSDNSPSLTTRSGQLGSAPRPSRRKRQPVRNDEFVCTEAACQLRRVDAKRSPSLHSIPPPHAPPCAHSEPDDGCSTGASRIRGRGRRGGRGRGRWGCRPLAAAGARQEAATSGWDNDTAIASASRASPAAWMTAARAAARSSEGKATAHDAPDHSANGTDGRDFADVLVDGVVEVRVEWKNRDTVRGVGSQGDVLVARCADLAIAKVRPPVPETILSAVHSQDKCGPVKLVFAAMSGRVCSVRAHCSLEHALACRACGLPHRVQSLSQPSIAGQPSKGGGVFP